MSFKEFLLNEEEQAFQDAIVKLEERWLPMMSKFAETLEKFGQEYQKYGKILGHLVNLEYADLGTYGNYCRRASGDFQKIAVVLRQFPSNALRSAEDLLTRYWVPLMDSLSSLFHAMDEEWQRKREIEGVGGPFQGVANYLTEIPYFAARLRSGIENLTATLQSIKMEKARAA